MENKNGMRIGFGQAAFTPNGAVAMIGLYRVRVADKAETPLLATAMAVTDGEKPPVYWVGCDLLYITDELVDAVCRRLSVVLPDFHRNQLILSATHIHTGPFLKEKMDTTLLSFPAEVSNVLSPEECCQQVADGIVQAILEAVKDKEPALTARANVDIKTGYCRRGVFTDGTAKMYPDVYRPDFSHLECRDGGAVKLVYVLREKDNTLKGVIADVPCPAQANVNTPYMHGDYWDITRCLVQERLEIPVLGICACAGDLSPRDLYDRDDTDTDKRMQKLGKIIGGAIIEKSADLVPDTPVMAHIFKEIPLKIWRPTPAQYQRAKSVCKQLYKQYSFCEGQVPFQKEGFPKYLYSEAEAIIRRFLRKEETVSTPIHGLRLGDAVFISNPFECFTEYADRIAMQFLGSDIYDVQLTDQYYGYLPTRDAVYGGGYSACIYNGICDPDGGDALVRESAEILKNLT